MLFQKERFGRKTEVREPEVVPGEKILGDGINLYLGHTNGSTCVTKNTDIEISDDEEAKAGGERRSFRQKHIHEAGIRTIFSCHLLFTDKGVILRRRLEYTSCETVRIIRDMNLNADTKVKLPISPKPVLDLSQLKQIEIALEYTSLLPNTQHSANLPSLSMFHDLYTRNLLYSFRSRSNGKDGHSLWLE